MRTVATKNESEQLVAGRRAALAAAKAVNAEPGDHVRGGMHVLQAEEALQLAVALLAGFK